ncbi:MULTISPECIES: glutamine-hydrolyzing carbamoyl-phosphate synthase small subunit [unclassified Microbacterium]|jgi:carbamoyl-phosphate synthase small subunit|uniref:glutamine-hydrolyzing carbamoyl-phosphate synthase small subunit n=1 Tax=unclassified Microbacterium TaxID=2609290 RepID=UPI000CFC75A9|nr:MULTISPECIES: glutamine-hydrolyzing carbamoyl-phosphate synthase small subunit [unclassified Microbacterium]PQZ61021.1 carbamoyl phosphate synthase small subunit [Microbacterium sp. MYb43]PQZ82230.1 carbamoyl phosphate synthase small subunit [Microbacterium sp. MYb40]PRB24068.1 carbamoyl phosphate synthase small subunit [Microbacterium sp. MYb54]PRB30899.1 carbamoyl phosphate synthase small subunit [Microbacterium sp. MYb50]PRB70678.1 carbamoyl phosphate synthase small subunit [Microbacteri
MTLSTNSGQTPAAQLPDPAVLVLEDGTRHTGRAYGARGRTLGEVVFATGMSGYQETITDPSYAGQIVLQTAPHIGNTGMNDEDAESRRIWVAGYIVRDPSRVVSNWRANASLDDVLVEDGIVGISGIDTRSITRHIRSAGSMRGGIFSGADAALDPDEQVRIVREAPEMAGRNLSAEVSVDVATVTTAMGERIGNLAVLDLGVKQATIDNLAARGFEVHVLPQSVTIDEIRAVDPVAVFYSNGPGDPAASGDHVELLRSVLDDGLPFFGICFGNQLLGRALGLGTYKLPFGHRGINQPVLDKQTGKVEITAHNHGFAVEAPIEGTFDSPNGYGKVEVSHVGLNDNVVEGLRALDIPAFSVQYHPEAAAGPHDANYLFDRFRDLVIASQKDSK